MLRLVVAATVVTLPISASAQGSARAAKSDPGQTGCVSCVIRVAPSLTIDGRNAGSRTTQFSEVYRLPSGRFVVGALEDQSHAVLEPDGSFVGRLGGEIDRPKGMPVVARIVGDARDSIYFYDNLLQREFIFAPSLKPVRTRALPLPPFLVLRLPQGRLLVHSKIGTEPRAGYPFHIVERSGRISRSFGVDRPQVLPDRPYEEFRLMAPARDSGAFWSAHRNRYTIEKWTVEGRRLLSINRNVPWFEPWDREPDAPVRAVKPVPALNAVWEDDHGFVWTLIRVPKVDWKPSGAPRKPGDGEDFPTVDDLMAAFDTIIEVIEPRTSRVLASTRVPGVFGLFLPGNLLVGMQSKDGQAVLELSRVTLEDAKGSTHR